MKSTIDPQEVQALVAKAFVLEAITDKPGCTTRYKDLEGKPLQDFIVAGINSSVVFYDFAKSCKSSMQVPLFDYFETALKVSNIHKSDKYINFGLLEIMFQTVAARLSTNNPKAVIDQIIIHAKNSTNNDIQHFAKAKQLAWATSTNPYKVHYDYSYYSKMNSLWEHYEAIRHTAPKESSGYNWATQFIHNLPMLRNFFNTYVDNGEVMHSTKDVFLDQKEKNPHVPNGIIADMCAAAIFLWLSFHDTHV